MDAARAGARLELRQKTVAVARARRRERGGIDHHDAGRHVGEPAAERDDERLKAPGQLLGGGPALGALERGPRLVEAERRPGVPRDEQGGGRRRRAARGGDGRGPGAARRTGLVLPGQAQHGSTCTVTSCSRRSRLSRSSTWSAIAWADSTSAWRSTHTVTSA